MSAGAIPSSGGGQSSGATQAARAAGGRSRAAGRPDGAWSGGRPEGMKQGKRPEGGQQPMHSRRGEGGQRTPESISSRVDARLEQTGVSEEMRATVVEQLNASLSDLRSSDSSPMGQQVRQAVKAVRQSNGLSASQLPSGAFLDQQA